MTSTPTWCLENRGSFASIHVILPAGTKVHCETDAVVTFSGGVQVEGVMSGGFLGSVFRMIFGGESFFTTVVENKSHEQPGDVMMAAADPGGIELHRLAPQQDLLLMAGAYVASDANVTISTEMQTKLNNSLFSGTGFFLLRASGRGTLAIAAYGSIHKYELKAGETRAVDNGHLVAWTASTQYRVGLANARGGIITSMKSGEGLMCHFQGPGTIYLQSHKPGEAETVVKHGKSKAKSTAQASVAIYLLVPFVILVVLVAAMMAAGSGNIQFQTKNSNSYRGDQYQSDYGSHRSRTSQGYRTVGEF